MFQSASSRIPTEFLAVFLINESNQWSSTMSQEGLMVPDSKNVRILSWPDPRILSQRLRSHCLESFANDLTVMAETLCSIALA